MELSKSIVSSFYDLQKERIQVGNRICAEIKARLGQEPSKPEKGLDAEAKKYLAQARIEYKRITDAFVRGRADKNIEIDFEKNHIIVDEVMLEFVKLYERLLANEEDMGKYIEKQVYVQPIWKDFLKGVKGVGPLMSAVILAKLDIRAADHISSFWKYAGLDVVIDENGKGKGRCRCKDHLIEVEYINKKGEKTKRDSITFNPFLKTKLIGVLGPSFVKQKDSRYRDIYDGYKHRIENHPGHAEKTKGHRNNMAIRYTVKIFLQDLWLAWRKLEGLPITPPYAEAKLGLKHDETVKV